MNTKATEPRSASSRLPLQGLNLALFLVGIIVIAVVVNFFAARPSLRLRLDATKTRAYSLTEQTRGMLADLQGDWTVAMVMVQENIDLAVRRQVDEVLKRYAQASQHISVVYIDPTDPQSLDEYEQLLTRLRSLYTDRVAEYDQALRQGRAAADSFSVFLQQQTGGLGSLRQSLDAEDSSREEIEQLLSVLALRLQQTEQVTQELDRAMRFDDSRPLPDYEAARSVLAAALGGWAQEQFRIVQMFDRWRQGADADPGVRRFAAQQRESYDLQAQTLAMAADPLTQLPPLELARVGRALEQGDAAIVLGPRSAAVIPSQQIFPRMNLRVTGTGDVAFDLRFRGEQVISAAIRALREAYLPMVIFVHAQGESMLRRRDRNVDLVGAASVLEASRYPVQEWIVGQSDRPSPPQDQPVVWVVVPPPTRSSIEPAKSEQDLIDAVGELLADGEAVMLNVYPSRLPKFGRPDPWHQVPRPFGLEADTAHVVFEQVRVSRTEISRERGQVLRDFPADHPIARALHGQQMYVALPVPIRVSDEVPSGVQHHAVAHIAPSANRWLEEDWAVDPQDLDDPKPEEQFAEPVPIVVAAQRDEQRFMVVGSGGWMLSYIADAVIPLGGDRVALANPGNHELLLASAAWLAGMDDLIAPSPVSQQVARLDGITPQVQRRWRWIVLAGMPGCYLLLGVLVWQVRRR